MTVARKGVGVRGRAGKEMRKIKEVVVYQRDIAYHRGQRSGRGGFNKRGKGSFQIIFTGERKKRDKNSRMRTRDLYSE